MTKQAKVLEEYEINDLRRWIATNSKMPERDDLIFLLSFRAGLRGAEISKLDLDAMLDASGKINSKIIIDKAVGKYGRPRDLPMHPEIADALLRFRRRYPDATYVALGIYKKNERLNAKALIWYMIDVLKRAGFKGASSHSGRRTFVTSLARRANRFDRSLRDVQRLAGHARLDTTERYVDTTEEVFSLVASLGTVG